VLPRTGPVRRTLLLMSLLGGCNRAHAPALEGTTSEAAESFEDVPRSVVDAPERALPDAYVVRGAVVVGVGRADVEVTGDRISAIGSIERDELPEIDARGRWLVPAFIDSHVHLAYAFDAPTLAQGGVAGAVDLAAPIETLAIDRAPLQVIASGPMITALKGYPTNSWGADGYGLEIAGVDAAKSAVDELFDAGARVIKVPIGSGPALRDEELRAIVERAHHHGLKVAAHALADDEASRAARAGVDVLAHTPVEPLSHSTVQAWSERAVVSTLDAFGGSAAAVDNLRRLREAGTIVLYGTDLGNSSIPAIDPNEIELLVEAGLEGAAVLEAGTSVPASFWGFDGLGALAEGERASFLVLRADPRRDPGAFGSPEAVFVDGDHL
jgi:imidazolonepropionase-like amidohydrolase